MNNRCILLTTGAMSPVHRGHIHALAAAKRHLEGEGWEVLKVYLSPSHDLYLKHKFGVPELRCPLERRLDIARLVAQGAQEGVEVEVATWESDPRHPYWPDFPEVIAHHAAEARAALGGDVVTFYACGADHARHCGGLPHLVVVPRGEGERLPAPRAGWHVTPPPPAEVRALSSSAARAALARGDRHALLAHLVEGAVEYVERWGVGFDSRG